MIEEKKCEVDYEEKMKIDASPQEELKAIFRQADLPERKSDTDLPPKTGPVNTLELVGRKGSKMKRDEAKARLVHGAEEMFEAMWDLGVEHPQANFNEIASKLSQDRLELMGETLRKML